MRESKIRFCAIALGTARQIAASSAPVDKRRKLNALRTVVIAEPRGKNHSLATLDGETYVVYRTVSSLQLDLCAELVSQCCHLLTE